jgi:NAD(P)H-hydrate epimerase
MYQGFPVVTPARMRELDYLAAEKHGLSFLELMENAGWAVAAEAVLYIQGERGGNIAGEELVACCGRGANGGDGLVACRVLRERGAKVTAFLCPPKAGGGYPEFIRINLDKARSAGVSILEAGPPSVLREKLTSCAVVLDALLGTGSRGKPAGVVYHMVSEINASGKPVLSVDVPSGLDAGTGLHGGIAVKASVTLTLGLPKRGLLEPHALGFVGCLKVLDIGYPTELFSGEKGSIQFEVKGQT